MARLFGYVQRRVDHLSPRGSKKDVPLSVKSHARSAACVVRAVRWKLFVTQTTARTLSFETRKSLGGPTVVASRHNRMVRPHENGANLSSRTISSGCNRLGKLNAVNIPVGTNLVCHWSLVLCGFFQYFVNMQTSHHGGLPSRCCTGLCLGQGGFRFSSSHHVRRTTLPSSSVALTRG